MLVMRWTPAKISFVTTVWPVKHFGSYLTSSSRSINIRKKSSEELESITISQEVRKEKERNLKVKDLSVANDIPCEDDSSGAPLITSSSLDGLSILLFFSLHVESP